MKTKQFIYIFIGSILSIIVISIIVFWLSLFVGNTNTYIENDRIFSNYFPKIVMTIGLSPIMILFNVVAIYLFIKTKNNITSTLKKKVVEIILIVNYITLSWLIFTML